MLQHNPTQPSLASHLVQEQFEQSANNYSQPLLVKDLLTKAGGSSGGSLYP